MRVGVEWISSSAILFGRDSDLRIPTTPLPRSVRCSRSAGDEAARTPLATACAAHFVRVIPARASYHPCEKVKRLQGC